MTVASVEPPESRCSVLFCERRPCRGRLVSDGGRTVNMQKSFQDRLASSSVRCYDRNASSFSYDRQGIRFAGRFRIDSFTIVGPRAISRRIGLLGRKGRDLGPNGGPSPGERGRQLPCPEILPSTPLLINHYIFLSAHRKQKQGGSYRIAWIADHSAGGSPGSADFWSARIGRGVGWRRLAGGGRAPSLPRGEYAGRRGLRLRGRNRLKSLGTEDGRLTQWATRRYPNRLKERAAYRGVGVGLRMRGDLPWRQSRSALQPARPIHCWRRRAPRLRASARGAESPRRRRRRRRLDVSFPFAAIFGAIEWARTCLRPPS